MLTRLGFITSIRDPRRARLRTSAVDVDSPCSAVHATWEPDATRPAEICSNCGGPRKREAPWSCRHQHLRIGDAHHVQQFHQTYQVGVAPRVQVQCHSENNVLSRKWQNIYFHIHFRLFIAVSFPQGEFWTVFVAFF